MIERNAGALTRRPKLMAALISAAPLAGLDWPDSRRGPPAPVWTDFAGRARRLHSGVDPEGEAEKMAEAALAGASGGSARAKRALMVGHGAGYDIRAISRRVDRLWVIAANIPFLRAVCDRIDVSDILEDPKVVWLFGSPDELAIMLAESGAAESGEGGETALVIHPPFLELVPAEFAGLVEAVRKIRSGRDTEDSIRPVAESNLRRNLSALSAPGVAEIYGAARGRPVILAGAGPTLDESLPVVERLYPSSVLIAVDTVAEGLMAAGYPPDLVVSVDPRPESTMHFRLMSADVDGPASTLLVFTPITHPDVVAQFSGRRLLAIPRNHFLLKPAEPALAAKGVLTAGGSVSVLAAALAVALEPAYVCLAGIDFRAGQGRFYSLLSSYHRSAQAGDSRFSSPELLEHSIFKRETHETAAGVTAPRLKNYAADFRHVVRESPVPFYSAGPAPVEGVRSGVLPCVTAGAWKRPMRAPSDGADLGLDIAALCGMRS